ncbi:ion transporter [Reinekea thalattae]|uniref:Ion transporter n=1 Tax=Reinekea thalattae TaxID=2593301 RepID=A0A5C8Z2A8_9GAMM|nr:ion transporter [Reinekea thalattae]TXR51343.1 ion transporter [Reinekea thalattae]
MLQPLRKSTARILSVDGNHRYSRIVDLVLIGLIALNVLAIILESVTEFEQQHQLALQLFDYFSVSVFTIEYLLRVWSCVELAGYEDDTPAKARLKYIFTPLAVFDFLAIAPFYLAFFISLDLRFLRVVRLLRVFKLTRYSGAMNLVLDVFKEESSAFFAAFFVLITLLILASSGIYLIEHDIQPEVFGSIPDAMWWAMATLTTVGYGDSVPVSAGGKIFGGLITIIGMGMVALPAGILASGFIDQVHRRRSLYSNQLEQVFGDGVITEEKQNNLERLREQLGLSEEDVEILTLEYLKKYPSKDLRCPHCHQPFFDNSHNQTKS